jgi:D-alanyl-D-alanine carboxypeptidase
LTIQKIVSVVALSAALLKGGMDKAMPDKDIDGTLFLLNRAHVISEAYIPDVRVVNAVGMRQSMRADAATALEEMFAAAKADKVGLSTVSGYRSFSKQETIYARKQKTAGQETADALVALPGSSEHQLGLAMDVAQKGGSQLNGGFGKTKAGKWVAENAWRFGFILRYPEGQETVTGIAFEPWHLRYVGKAHAKAIFESGEPLEIYVSAHRLAVFEYLLKHSNE